MCQEPTLQVVNHSRVFALGDTSSQGCDIPSFPTTAQVAFQQADYVAWNLWASINGRQLLSFRLAASIDATVCQFCLLKLMSTEISCYHIYHSIFHRL